MLLRLSGACNLMLRIFTVAKSWKMSFKIHQYFSDRLSRMSCVDHFALFAPLVWMMKSNSTPCLQTSLRMKSYCHLNSN